MVRYRTLNYYREYLYTAPYGICIPYGAVGFLSLGFLSLGFLSVGVLSVGFLSCGGFVTLPYKSHILTKLV